MEPRSHLCPCSQVCPRGRRSAVTAFTHNSSAYHPDHTPADVRAATSAAVHPNRVATAATDKGDGGRAHFADESSRPTQSMKLIADVSMRSTGRKCFKQQDQDHCSSIHPQITHHLLSSGKPRDRESGGNWCTIHIARPFSLRYLPAHDR